MNKQFILEQLGQINNYLNRISLELSKEECHDYYIHELAFCGINKFKAILNESKSEVTDVSNEDKGIDRVDESKQEETTCDDTGTGSTTSSTTENNQSVDKVQPNDRETIGDSRECNSNEG